MRLGYAVVRQGFRSHKRPLRVGHVLCSGGQERSRRLHSRREGERKRKEKEEAETEARRAEAEERARQKVWAFCNRSAYCIMSIIISVVWHVVWPSSGCWRTAMSMCTCKIWSITCKSQPRPDTMVVVVVVVVDGFFASFSVRLQQSF